MRADAKIYNFSDRFWLFFSLTSLSILHLNLIWKATENIDHLTIDIFFWAAIIWLFWQKCDRLNYQSHPSSSFLGLLLLGIVLFKTLNLFWFEFALLSLLPFLFAISLLLIFCGTKFLIGFWQELLIIWFVFFPTERIEAIMENLTHATVLIAKLSSYTLYYFGFDVVSQGNEVIIFLPAGEFKAIVNYACTGLPMVLLNLKLALLLINLFPVNKIQRFIVPLVSIVIGFLLGTIRVCIMTLAIQNSARFEYWHGTNGSQIFSTIGITIFSIYCYWVIQRVEKNNIQKLP